MSFLSGRRGVVTVAIVAAITAVVAAAAAAVAVTTSGSNRPAASGRPTTTTATTAPAGTTTTTAPPSNDTTTSSTTARTPGCGAADLSITVSPLQATAGHAAVALVFQNSGSSTCAIGGYPGVDGVLTGGQQVSATRTLNGSVGGVRSGSASIVTLSPGDAASAMVEDANQQFGSSAACNQLTSFNVTIPNTTATSALQVSLPYCSNLEVHPLVPGTSGSSG